jgi:hypothetical protein
MSDEEDDEDDDAPSPSDKGKGDQRDRIAGALVDRMYVEPATRDWSFLPRITLETPEQQRSLLPRLGGSLDVPLGAGTMSLQGEYARPETRGTGADWGVMLKYKRSF